MKILGTITVAIALGVTFAADSFAQKPKAKETAQQTIATDDAYIRSSAAFAEVLLRQTELSANLEALLEEYTENYPKVIDTRLQLASINGDIVRLFAVKPESAGKLTAALGRLIVRRSELFSEYQTASKQYEADNPIVKRAKKAYESFSKSIDDILR